MRISIMDRLTKNKTNKNDKSPLEKRWLTKGVQGCFVLTSLFLLCPANSAQARTPISIGQATGSADAARIQQDISNLDHPPISVQNAAPSKAPAQNAPENAEEILFTLKDITFDGVGVYDAKTLDAFYKDKLGQTISLADIFSIANALTVYYRNDGYVLTHVFVPPQSITDGVVRLEATEGFVDTVMLQGSLEDREMKQITAYSQVLREERPLRAQTLERIMLLINDIPGVQARAVLKKSSTTSGATSVTILVERDKYEGFVNFNNYGSRYLGPYYAMASGAVNGLLGLNEKIKLRLANSGDIDNHSEARYASLTYQQPINIIDHGDRIELTATYTGTEPGSDLEEYNVKGRTRFLSASFFHPIIRSRQKNLIARAVLDWRNNDSKNDLELNSRRDRIRSLRLGANFQFSDRFLSGGNNLIDAQISRGLNILGASQRNDANMTRANGNPKYTKANLKLQRSQRLTNSLSLFTYVHGQWASSALLSAEEFGVGGAILGRGYDPSEILGEDGLAGKVELRWRLPSKYDFKYARGTQLYSFYDAGRVWEHDATTSANKRQSLASTGFGFNTDLGGNTRGGASVALPLTRNAGVREDHDPRFYVYLTHKF